jgi:hypothetical protein
MTLRAWFWSDQKPGSTDFCSSAVISFSRLAMSKTLQENRDAGV